MKYITEYEIIVSLLKFKESVKFFQETKRILV